MAAFAFLYIILIVYSVVLRLSVRVEVKENGSVGLLYKIQAATVIVISLALGTSLNYLFAQSTVEWMFQYLPTAVCIGILFLCQRVKGRYNYLNF